MTDIFDERRKGLEEEEFRRKDKETLARLREHIRQEAHKHSNDPVTMNCPRCTGKLHAENYNEVQLDRCDTCGGVWVDAGELQEILTQDSPASRWFHAFWPGRTGE